MKLCQVTFVVVALLLCVAVMQIEAKRGRKHKHHHGGDTGDSRKTKTKTKWSTSTDLGSSATNSMVATEEHGYYVKRTFLPLNATERNLRSPPFLAIPIAWFSCEGNAACQKSNSGAINGASNALSEGFLCDDDCVEPYEPICGKTSSEVAVFYNKCKLNVAKCRTHGLWSDLAYDECQKTYPKETEYTDKKFRASPYFRDNSTQLETADCDDKKSEQDNSSTDSSEENTQDAKKATKSQNVTEKVAAQPTPAPMTANEKAALAAMDEISNKLSEAEGKPQQQQQQQQNVKAQNDKDRLKYQIAN